MFKKFLKSIKFSLKRFSSKDDKFWEEYTKMKAQGGKYPSLPTQGIVANNVHFTWRYSDKYSLVSSELYDCITNLKREDKPEFIILDVREEIEYDLFKLPNKNKVI
jgi:hypothetical protein